MSIETLLPKLDKLANIDPTKVMLPGAHLLRNAAYQNYLVIDEDSYEDEFLYEECDEGAFVMAQEEFDINDVEFGNENHEAQPFFRPAIDDNTDAIVKAVADEINKLIKEI